MLFFGKKQFDFSGYLVKELGFCIMAEHPKGFTYEKDGIEVSVFKLIELHGYNKVQICCGGVEMATLKFIPKSKTMVDIMLNQIRFELDERQ